MTSQPQQLVALDLETTGLHPFFSQIVEIGAVAFDAESGAILERFSMLVNPGVPMPPAVIAIHGITDAMVADAPGLPEVFPLMEAFLAPYDVIIGHNISFDLGFIRHRAAQLQRPLKPSRCIDTVRLAKWAYPGLKSYRLSVLSALLDIASPRAHRALDDAVASQRLLLAGVQRLTEAGQVPSEIYERLLRPIGADKIQTGNLSPELAQLYDHCERGVRMIITYANAQHETTRRVIDPLGMQMVGGSHYVVAHCHFRQANRNFRVDRILEWAEVAMVPIEELLPRQGLLETGAPEELIEAEIR